MGLKTCGYDSVGGQDCLVDSGCKITSYYLGVPGDRLFCLNRRMRELQFLVEA